MCRVSSSAKLAIPHCISLSVDIFFFLCYDAKVSNRDHKMVTSFKLQLGLNCSIEQPSMMGQVKTELDSSARNVNVNVNVH